MTQDESAIRYVVEKWFTATKSGAPPTDLDLMTDDVIFMAPGQPPFGKKEFAAASEGMKNLQIDGTYDIQEVQVLGNWAYLRNHTRMTVTPPDGSPPCTAPAIRSPSCAKTQTDAGGSRATQTCWQQKPQRPHDDGIPK